jgi:class 3 adenylate cyclase
MPDHDLISWLESTGLSQYGALLTAQEIDFDVLTELTDDDLVKLGLPLGARRRLLKAIRTLNGDVDVIPQPVSDASPEPMGERRQLTVLFCDLVGFTELASRLDPELLQKIVHAYEDLCAAAVTRFEGFVFQRLGDGIVAFFGSPSHTRTRRSAPSAPASTSSPGFRDCVSWKPVRSPYVSASRPAWSSSLPLRRARSARP